jgi:NAD-dependent dihydropyrimidine dehydrogenase PreA subunit
MATMLRKIIKIDEELCDGCGLCVPACAEGAIQMIDGKARLVSDGYCDGLGACLGECPQGAISFEEREAEEYDEEAVLRRLGELGRSAEEHESKHVQPEPAAQRPVGLGGCPGSRMFDFTAEETDEAAGETPRLRSELRQWPVKLYLVNPAAPYFQGADLVLAADCTAFAYASFHPDYLKGKALAIGCPKFDDLELYKEKLEAIIGEGGIRSITVVHMEVPCCLGLLHAAREAILASGRDIPLDSVVISIRGDVKASPLCAGF